MFPNKSILDSNAIRCHIGTTYDITYSLTGVKELLHRLGFVYKKPKHAPGELDPQKQKAFVAEYEKLRKNFFRCRTKYREEL